MGIFVRVSIDIRGLFKFYILDVNDLEALMLPICTLYGNRKSNLILIPLPISVPNFFGKLGVFDSNQNFIKYYAHSKKV